MKRTKIIIHALAVVLLPALAGCGREGKLLIDFPEKFEGKTVELMEYMDSTVLGTATVCDGKAEFVTEENDSLRFPFFAQVVVDGRVNAYYIAEPGTAVVSDSTSVAAGTPLNDRFRTLMARLDSVDNLDDLPLYVDFVEREYNANRDNVMSDFLGVEWMKFADASKVDSFLNAARDGFRDTRRVRHYESFARHRLATAPGMRYTDFAGEDAAGRKVMLSQLMVPGRYTLVDMWASWCPYCIKEIPALKELVADFGPRGLDIIGVAVRDLPADTRQMVRKQDIPWKILYNTRKTPYDIYGFSGIPHHILVGPDGTIISRGENAAQIRARLGQLLGKGSGQN